MGDSFRILGSNQQSATAATHNLEVRKSSHTKQGHCLPAGVCWKMLLFMGASVLTYLGLVMEYPGLDESEGENGRITLD